MCRWFNYDNFDELWGTSQVFKKFYNFPSQLEGKCGECSNKWNGGGYKVLVMVGNNIKNFFKSDPDSIIYNSLMDRLL